MGERHTAYFDELLEQGCTRLDWCVVACRDRSVIARAALWALPGSEIPTDVVLLDARWDDPAGPDGARACLRVAEGLAEALGARRLTHLHDTPAVAPQYQEDEAARTARLDHAGYALVRDGLRWTRAAAAPTSEADTGLVFRSVSVVGRSTLLRTIRRTFDGSLDADIQADVDALGLDEAAEEYLAAHERLGHAPDWPASIRRFAPLDSPQRKPCGRRETAAP